MTGTLKKVAIIGYGALGQILAGAVRSNLADLYEVSGILELAEAGKEKIREDGFACCADLEELLAAGPDYVVEIAGVGAAKAYAVDVLTRGIPLVIVSIGSLADDAFRDAVREAAIQGGAKVYLPSGAIGGFDVLRTLHEMGGAQAVIESTKGPGSLNGAPFLGGRLLSEEHAETVFEGSAREAIAGFPKNVNVAVSSGLASVGVDDMRVIIRSEPGLTDNIHEVRAHNDDLDVTVRIRTTPDPQNPRSSRMTAWSVAALLRNLASPIEFF